MKNNRTITVSAPGKLLLMGDHAVVYGRPCIVTAVDSRMTMTVRITSDGLFVLDAPQVLSSSYTKPVKELGEGDIPRGAQFIEAAVSIFLNTYGAMDGLCIETSSVFLSTIGFGSSSAAVVCVLYALNHLYGTGMDEKALFDMSYKVVLSVQGVGSGFDVASAIWGGTLFFVGGGSTIEKMPIGILPLIVGYSGVKADTVTMIADVAKKYAENTQKMERIFDAIAKLVVDAKEKLLEGDWERVGTLMNFNQDYLRDIGVSTEKLEALIKSSKDAGSWGAKLSGAGGGDCMIALCSPDSYEHVSSAITASGGTVIGTTCGAQGVRIETTDNQDELLIVVNTNDEIVGYTSRSACHADPSLLHRTVGVLLKNDAGEILLQKRSMTKDMDAGLWGISAAGHVTKGQTDEDAAHREMMEELGVDTHLTFVGTMLIQTEKESERAALFTGTHNGPFTIHPQEVDEVMFMQPDRIRESVDSGSLVFTEGALKSLQLIGVLS